MNCLDGQFQLINSQTDDLPKKMSTNIFIVNLPEGPTWFVFLVPCDELWS